MNILFVSPRFPYPPFKGDQLTVYRRLEQVSKIHCVTLLTFSYDNHPDGIQELRKLCVGGVFYVPFSKYLALLRVGLMAPFTDEPMQCLLYQSKDFAKKLRDILAEQHIDLVHFFLDRTAQYKKFIHNIPCVIDVMDSMALNMKRRALIEHGVMSYICKNEMKRLIAYEKNLSNYFNQLIAVSAIDGKYFDTPKITYIPSTVDIKKFQPYNPKKTKDNVIVFSGIMSYAPNIHAVKWFVKHVYPILHQLNVKFIFRIIGKDPTREIKRLVQGKDDIELTGYVESMCEALNSAKVSVAPMQSGSGMQGKVIEAMACGIPVVATTIGKGAVIAEHDDGLYVENEPQQFANTIAWLLGHDDERLCAGIRARKFVELHHSNEATLPILQSLYQEVAQEWQEECVCVAKVTEGESKS